MTTITAVRNLVGAIAVVALFQSLVPAPAQERTTSAQREWKSAANLYLMRNLEHTLGTWKPPTANPDELGVWIYKTRTRLNTLKTMAEDHHLDESVIRAYGGMLGLLKAYEDYVKNVVLYNLVANVARPEQKGFIDIATTGMSGGASGAAIGGALGSFFPVVGNIAGGVIGAGLGTAVGIFQGIKDDWESTDRSGAIDAKLRTSRAQLVDLLCLNFKSDVQNLKERAENLAGPAKYGWGSAVGFDGSDRLPFEDQLRFRPNDPFLHMALAMHKAPANPKEAAKLLARAAELVPQDPDPSVDRFDKDRAEFLLAAARIAEYGSRNGTSRDASLAHDAIAYYEAARTCLNRGDKEFTREAKLTYARACVLAGRAGVAEEVMAQVLGEKSDDPWLCYECAAVKSQLGNGDAALQQLRRSFELRPRWQPAAPADVRFGNLNLIHRAEVERICVNPLFGRWSSDTLKLTMDFYLDGSFRQILRGEVKTGSYQLQGNQIRLMVPNRTKDYTCTITKTQLTLADAGSRFELSRASSLFGAWKCGGDSLDLRDDGTWREQVGSTTTAGTFAILPPNKVDAEHEIVFAHEDVLRGIVEKRMKYRMKGATIFRDTTLELLHSNDPAKWREYKR